MSDPNVQMNARPGQGQHGVDMFGFRDRDPARPVGIQCKLKGDGTRLSESEVRDEVEKALSFEPKLSEYFIVTTSPDDRDLQRLARQMTIDVADAGSRFAVNVWGWETLEQHITAHLEAANAFDPTYGPQARLQNTLLAQIVDGMASAPRLTLRPSPILHRLPSLPKPYQPPARELEVVRPILIANDRHAVGILGESTGLIGMGGIGKTVLAAALVHDPVVRDAFPAGIVWLTFGRDAQMLVKQDELALALSGVPRASRDLSEAHGVLDLLSQQLPAPLLVVLDDVWEIEGAQAAFGDLPRNLRLLVTTRNRKVAEALGAKPHTIGLLDSDSALDFLAISAGQTRAELPTESGEVLRRCGGLPLALAAVGALVRHGTYSWREVLEALRTANLRELPASWQRDPAQSNVAAVLKVSVDALSEPARACLLDFAVLREDFPVPEVALVNIWSEPAGSSRLARAIARDLADRSVLLRDEMRRYTIHDLFRDFLRDTLGDLQIRHRELLGRYRRQCPNGWNEGPNDGYFFQSIVWHMSELGDASALLFDPLWLQTKLEAVGIGEVVADYRHARGDAEASRVAAALRLSSARLAQSAKHLPAQLCGRITSQEGPRIASLVAAARRRLPAAFMIPICDGFLDRPGQLIRILQAHTGFVNAIAVTGDGRKAVSASEDRTMILWDLDTGAPLHRFASHERGVNAVAIWEARGEVLSGSDDGTLKVWGLETGELLATMDGEGGSIDFLAILPDQWRAVSASSAGGMALWDLARRERLHRFDCGQRVTCLTCLPDGNVVSGAANGEVTLWDPIRGRALRNFSGHTDIVRGVIMLPDGQSILAVADDSTACSWSLIDATRQQRLLSVPVAGRAVAALQQSQTAVSGMTDGTLRLWDLRDGRPLAGIAAHSGIVSAVMPIPGRAHLLSGSHDESMRMWDLAAPATERDDLACASGIYSLALPPSGSLLLSGSEDGTVRVWDLSAATMKTHFAGHQGPVRGLAFLRDGQHAVSGAEAGDLKILDIAGGRVSRSIMTGRGLICQILPIDAELVLVAGGPGTLDLWDLKSEAVLAGTDHHRHSINSLALTPDRTRVVSGSSDNDIRLWDVATRRTLRVFEGHASGVCTVQVFPNGRELLSGSMDGELRRWDIATAKTTKILVKGKIRGDAQRGGAGSPEILNAQLLPGAELAVLCCGDSTVRIWDLNADQEVRSFVDDHAVGVCAMTRDATLLLAANQVGRIHRFRLA